MFPATAQASKDTPREEKRRVPSYDESIQGHPSKKVGEERKEKKRDRERERESERKREKREEERKGSRQVFPATSKRPGTHTKARGAPEWFIQEYTKRKGRERRRGRVRKGGLRSRQVPLILEQALVAATTWWRARMAGRLLTALVTSWRVRRRSSLEFNNPSNLGKFLWHKPPAVRFGHLRSWVGGTTTNPRSSWHEARHSYGNAY